MKPTTVTSTYRSFRRPASGASMRICFSSVVAQIAFSLCIAAQTIQPPGNQGTVLMDRKKEITLALSACPQPIADKAAVYVLEKTGYLKIRNSQNGFTAIVQHAIPNSQDPQCMGAEGTRTFLPRY